MSTRSRIGILRKDGTIDSIYCHLDGYPEGVGVELYSNYKSKYKIEELIKLGDISHLEKEVNPDPSKPHEFGLGTEQKDVVVAYHRDRGEKLNILHSNNIDDFQKYCTKSDQEFAYLYDLNNRNWLYAKIPYSYSEDYHLDFINLKDKLIDLNIIDYKNDKYENLLWKILDYEKDNDFYEYQDEFDSDEEAYEYFENSFSEKGFNDYKLSLQDNMYLIKDERYDETLGPLYNSMEQLIKDIDNYQDDLEL